MSQSLCISCKYPRETTDQRAGLAQVEHVKKLFLNERQILAPCSKGHGDGCASRFHTPRSPANRNAIETYADLRPGFRPAVGFKLILNPSRANLSLYRKPLPALCRPERLPCLQRPMLVAKPDKPRSRFGRPAGVGRRLPRPNHLPTCVKSGDRRQNSMRGSSIEPIDLVNLVDSERPDIQHDCRRTTGGKRISEMTWRSYAASPRARIAATRQCRPAPLVEERIPLGHSTSSCDEVSGTDKNTRLCITLPSASNLTSPDTALCPKFGC